MAEKNFTFHINVGDAYITSLEELLKHPGHEEAVREAYHQVKLMQSQGTLSSDEERAYFPDDDFYQEAFGANGNNAARYIEDNTGRPSDSSRIISRNSPQHNSDHSDRAANKEQKQLSSDSPSNYYKFKNILCLSVLLFKILIDL